MRAPQPKTKSFSSRLVRVSGGSAADRAELTQILEGEGYRVSQHPVGEYGTASGETGGQPETLSAEIESGLSPREQEVLEFASRGFPDKAIAGELGISMRTVRYHLDRAMRKLGAHNRTEAVTRSGLGSRFM